MEKFVLLPHDKYQKLSLGHQTVPYMANQLQKYKIRKKVELKRDKKLARGG